MGRSEAQGDFSTAQRADASRVIGELAASKNGATSHLLRYRAVVLVSECFKQEGCLKVLQLHSGTRCSSKRHQTQLGTD